MKLVNCFVTIYAIFSYSRLIKDTKYARQYKEKILCGPRIDFRKETLRRSDKGWKAESNKLLKRWKFM